MFKEMFIEKTIRADRSVKGRYSQLKNMDKETLISVFKQQSNVVNTKGVPKEDMISDILNNEFSRKEIDNTFNEGKKASKLTPTEKSFGRYDVWFWDDIREFRIKGSGSYGHSLAQMTYDEAKSGKYNDGRPFNSPYHSIIPDILKYIKNK